tara:strand:+ start:235 stop:489 length:255 start_codon:yes stop_codon:yes gene_type:complete
MAIWDIKERNDLVRANDVRGDKALFAGLNSNNIIDFVNINSSGSGTDFGDLSSARGGGGAGSSSIRAVFGGGYSGGGVNIIDYV